nr:MAG TPA: hypothetical protein [Caudoviricetes sp.]
MGSGTWILKIPGWAVRTRKLNTPYNETPTIGRNTPCPTAPSSRRSLCTTRSRFGCTSTTSRRQLIPCTRTRSSGLLTSGLLRIT